MWKYYIIILKSTSKDESYISQFKFDDLCILAILEPQLWAEFITNAKLEDDQTVINHIYTVLNSDNCSVKFMVSNKNLKKITSDYIKSGFSRIINPFKDPLKSSEIPTIPRFRLHKSDRYNSLGKACDVKKTKLEKMNVNQINELLQDQSLPVIIITIL